MATYLIFYTSKDGWEDCYEVVGSKTLIRAIKWLHGDEVKATRIEIFKEGKSFDEDPDDIVEVYKNYWK